MKKLLTLTAAIALAAGVIAEAQQAGQQTPPPAQTKPDDKTRPDGKDKTDAQAAPSIAGKWTVSLTLPSSNDAVTAALEIKLDGKKVAGTITDRQGNPTPIQGEFADGKLGFAITVDGQNGPLQIAFNGALKENGTLAGTMDVGAAAGMPPINWTAERVKDK